jgi:hypothetical protein
MSIFTTIGNAISGFFKKELPVVENAFTSATTVVNVLKSFLGSATGTTVEAIIEALLPGTGTAVIGAINTFLTDFGLVAAEVTKTPAQITADGLNAIGNLTGNSRILALSNLATVIGDAASNANGGNSTLQQAIVAVPLVYKPTLLDSIRAAVSQVASAVAPNSAVANDINAANEVVQDLTNVPVGDSPAIS